MSNFKIFLTCLISLIIMGSLVVFFNFVVNKKDKTEIDTEKMVDVKDANNVGVIDGKLGDDLKITQGYLLSYTVRKSSIWYESSGYVKTIKLKKTLCTIQVEDKQKNVLTLTISQDKCNVAKGDFVNFVGTIDISEGILELAKISKNEIDYSNVEKIELDKLIENIKMIQKNIFIISGYMVTDNDKYKLFDSKDDSIKNSSAGNYFLINWKSEFLYTGNKNVTLSCNLAGTYELKSCELIK